MKSLEAHVVDILKALVATGWRDIVFLHGQAFLHTLTQTGTATLAREAGIFYVMDKDVFYIKDGLESIVVHLLQVRNMDNRRFHNEAVEDTAWPKRSLFPVLVTPAMVTYDYPYKEPIA